MDIYNVYLGEGYGSLRNPITFRDYEKHPYGSWEKNGNKAASYQNKSYAAPASRDHQAGHGGKSKDKCPFCKEQKKRPLVTYIRKRENKKHNESICEEEEEEEEQEEAEEQPQQKEEKTSLPKAPKAQQSS